MKEYQPTIGMEIHIELKTKTKMFCPCLNDPSEIHPNINVCPICLGHPGTLPTINKEAVESVIKIGLALGGQILKITKFDRKNYFYPDLPKGYQISQYDEPIVRGGKLNNIRIRRIHLEEDTGTLIHQEGGNSLIDFNRAGIPLVELVTEPDIRSSKEAREFCEDLQLILRYLGVSNADMEKGEMRLEANVSLNMGTKVEIKNINSFKALEAAIDYEIKRQKELLEEGKNIIQETRGWDDAKQITFSQRIKEEEQDYRYFPEPDLPPFETSIFDLEFLKKSLPELPHQKQKRFESEFGLSPSQAKILIQNQLLADFFEESASELQEFIKGYSLNKNPIEILYNYLTTDLIGLLNELKDDFYLSTEGLIFAGQLTPEKFAHLIALLLTNKIGSRQAKDILKISFQSGRDPEEVMKTEKLETIFNELELKDIVEKVINRNQKALLDYKKGKENAIEFLIGQTMREIGGRGDPNLIKSILIELLKGK